LHNKWKHWKITYLPTKKHENLCSDATHYYQWVENYNKIAKGEKHFLTKCNVFCCFSETEYNSFISEDAKENIDTD